VKIAAEIVVSEEIGVNCGSVRIIETKVDGAGVGNAAEKGLSGWHRTAKTRIIHSIPMVEHLRRH
jgi:hypothetical protein